MDSPARHPIQVAASRSGLNVDLIRAWERRYQAVTPQRSDSQRRLYRDEDIERLRLLAQATRAGRRIGDIAQLPTDKLQELIQTDEVARNDVPWQPSARPNTEIVGAYFEQCVAAVNDLNPEHLQQTLQEAEETLEEPFMQEDLIAPLVQHIQDECRQGSLRYAQKRMADNIIQSHLVHYATCPGNGRSNPWRAIVASMTLQEGTLPLLRLGVAVRAYGWSPIYLGHDIAADEVAYAAQRAHAGCITIATGAREDSLLPNELRKLRAALDADHPILLHGTHLNSYEVIVEEANITLLQTYGALRMELRRIQQASAPS